MSLVAQSLPFESKPTVKKFRTLDSHVARLDRYRRDIQVLRGIALIAVIFFHSNERLFPLGYLGVDVFFVISGFVITPLILQLLEQDLTKDRFSNLRYFFINRYYRLAPSLTVSLLLYVVLIFLLANPADLERFARQGIATLLLVGNFGAYKYSGDYFSSNPNALVHTWSLSVEEQIYIFLPLFLLVVFHGHKPTKLSVSLIFRLITILSFLLFLFPFILDPIYSLIGIQNSNLLNFYSPVGRIWEFTLGGLTYFMYKITISLNFQLLRISSFLLILGIFLLLFTPIAMSAQNGTIFATICTALLILFRSLDLLPKTVSNTMEWLGYRSYPIYLVHMPLIYLGKYSRATNFGSESDRGVQTVVAVISSILIGSLIHSKVENKFRNINKLRSDKNKGFKTTLLVASIFALMLLVTVDLGSKNKFWGLDRNISKPVYAGDLNYRCTANIEVNLECNFRNGFSTKTVLLIGDSHAAHISQAVVDAAGSKGWASQIWTYCRVVIERSNDDYVTDECLEYNKELFRWITLNKPDLIIISQYVRNFHNLANFKSAIKKISQESPNVLLIGNNPIFPDKSDYMVPRPYLMKPYDPPKKFLKEKMYLTDDKTSQHLANWAKDNGMLTLDFTSLFCKNNSCFRFYNRDWLYYDDNHFSIEGAKLTIPLLQQFMAGR